MPDNKNQHFVPKSYLRAFSVDAEKRSINVYNLTSGKPINGAPLKHQCSRDYFYGKDAALERAIQTIEAPYAPMVRHLRAGGAITSSVDLVLRRFMLLQHVRTEVAARDAAEMTMAFVDLPGSDFPIPPLSERTALAVQAAMFEYRENMCIVDDLKLRILRNVTDRPYVTSDNPAIFANRLYQRLRKAQRAPSWKSAGAILLMPLAPELLAILVDGDIYSIPHRGGFADVSRRRDIDALNEHQFLNLKANAYFADWRHREIVAEAAAAARPLRPASQHIVTHAVLESIDAGGEHFKVAPVSDIRDGRKRLVIVRPNRPRSSHWPSVLRFRPDGTAWTNGMDSAATRRGMLDLGSVDIVG